MPRARPRPTPLRDIENLLIEYVVVGREWDRFKCDCCDAPFDGTGNAYDTETWENLDLVELIARRDDPRVRSGYGTRVVDAVQVVGGEDWEYRPGEWAGYACPACSERINRHWIVLPGGPSDA